MPNAKRTTKPITVRLTREEEQRLRVGPAERGYPSVSALIRESARKKLGARELDDDGSERGYWSSSGDIRRNARCEIHLYESTVFQ